MLMNGIKDQFTYVLNSTLNDIYYSTVLFIVLSPFHGFLVPTAREITVNCGLANTYTMWWLADLYQLWSKDVLNVL